MRVSPGPLPIVALVSGTGTNLQALIEACAKESYGARIVGVVADRGGIEALARARRAGIRTTVVRLADHPDRAAWSATLTATVAAHGPRLVVCAGFMKILGPDFVDVFAGRILNTHPALLPSFPGARSVRDALAHGVKVTGCTCHVVDHGVDSGPIIAQGVVEVRDDDTEQSLHERIKVVERKLLVDCVGQICRQGLSVPQPKVLIP